MRVISSARELRNEVRQLRDSSKTIGLVPTMGALHRGHSALLRESRERDGATILSIYVNPSQFGPSEDFAQYPRDLERDLIMARESGVALVFTPTDEEMYPDGLDGQLIWIDPGSLGEVLEGQFRPGHFRGVATVVTKLFDIVKPDTAYFGQKDGQQAVVVRRLARDLNLGIDILIVDTIREPDGLALSSRNVYLTDEERRQAPAIYRGLSKASAAFGSGLRDAKALVGIGEEAIRLDAPAVRIEYTAMADGQTLQRVNTIHAPALLLCAAYLGGTRLIDNVVLDPAG